MDASSAISPRKDEHLDIVLSGQARATVATGLEAVRFEHCALPEMSLDEVDLSQRFLEHDLAAPLIISSMTGGPARAEAINENLAHAARRLGIALAVGSQRIAMEGRAGHGLGSRLRDLARGIPLFANFGGAQLAAGYGVRQARQAIEMIGADALIIHLNPLQEAVQPEGDRNWSGVLAGIERLARESGSPVVVKEVGNGISAGVARRLRDAGAAAIDVAGAGGTSWAAVEAGRALSPGERAVALGFAGWGIPTAQAIRGVRRACPDLPVIGSGGIRSGLDVARALRLGATIVGQAAGMLEPALDSPDAVVAHVETMLRELRIACFCTGSRNLAALRRAPLLAPDSLHAD